MKDAQLWHNLQYLLVGLLTSMSNKRQEFVNIPQPLREAPPSPSRQMPVLGLLGEEPGRGNNIPYVSFSDLGETRALRMESEVARRATLRLGV